MKINHLRKISIIFFFFVLLAGCAQNKMEPIKENYEYSQKSIYYLEPDISAGAVRKTALTTSTDDGNFYVFSEYESVANEFVNAQRTLVVYLRSQGAHIDEMTYYGMDYGYYHHLECELTGKSEHSWQSQAFYEIGASHSQYRPEGMEKILSEAGSGTDLFYMCTGRAYQAERNDYYEAFDILCFAEDYYELQYTGAESVNSFSRYLMDIYGEKTVCELMLYPDTVEEVTGETWVQLASKWEQHIREKYDGVKIPFIE